MSSSAREVSSQRAAIIGAGIIGLSAAWRLAQRGWKVTIFDQSTVGREASWAGAGMLAPGGEVEKESPMLAPLLASRQLYADFVSELASESGETIDFQQNGALDLAYGDGEWGELQARAERQRALGIRSKPLPTARVRAFWPRVRVEGLTGALFYPGDAIVNSREVVDALRIACLRRGVAIRERARVCSLEVTSSQVSVCTCTSSEPFTHAVVAAGAWSALIAVQGVPELPSSEPVKGHLLGYKQPLDTCSTIVRHKHTYLLQRANGLLIAGASAERIGFQSAIDEKIVRQLADEAGAVFPHLLETSPTEVWTGFRPGADALHVGPWHSERLLLAYGHYRNGILLAPWTAKTLADEFNRLFQETPNRLSRSEIRKR